VNEQQTDLRALRLALRKACDAAIAAEEAVTASVNGPLGYPNPEASELILARNCAQEDEMDAAEAFLAALDVVDPACHVCGCTDEDACIDDFGLGCHWVHKPGEPPLCSACRDQADAGQAKAMLSSLGTMSRKGADE
jgi:hypothetical protein